MDAAERVSDVRRANRATAGNWDLFTAHRSHLTALICAHCGPGVSRLAVVGAGNCNDLELGQLRGRASRIQLLDLDGEAVRMGLKRQGCAGAPDIEVLAGVDVTDTADVLAGCDVIVSTCLLSQLIAGLVERHGPQHPQLSRFVQDVRDRHLRFLARQLRPGGVGLVIVDFVSSDTCPAILTAANDAIEPLAAAALRDRNFFTGANPLVVVERLQAQAEPRVANVRVLKPWRWQMSPARAFLVCAVTFRRVGEGDRPVLASPHETPRHRRGRSGSSGTPGRRSAAGSDIQHLV